MSRYIEVGIRKKERKKEEEEELVVKQSMSNAGKQLSLPLHFILHEDVITKVIRSQNQIRFPRIKFYRILIHSDMKDEDRQAVPPHYAFIL
jgi:hypothetical protein